MVRVENEVRAFYQRWSRTVLMFSHPFPGKEAQAQKAAAQAFVVYLRGGLDLEEKTAPIAFLRCAVEAVRDRCAPPASQERGDRTSKGAIPLLPREQRAVLVLRNVLQLDAGFVATATGFSADVVRQLSFRSLLAIRERLSRDFFKEPAE